MNYGPVIPSLKVASLSKSLAFYHEVLGFTTKWTWSETSGFDAGDAATLACVESGEAVLFLAENGSGEPASLFVELPFSEDIDRLAARLAGRVDTDGPVNRPWGSRELWLQDPDGHSFRFSCPAERKAEP